MFRNIATALENCVLIKEEDAGSALTQGSIQIPDYFIVLKDGTQIFVARVLAVRHHQDEVELWCRLRPFSPKPLEDVGHAEKLGKALFLGMNGRFGRVNIANGDIRPIGELASLLSQKI